MVTIGLALFAPSPVEAQPESAERPPNVLVIFADDLGFGDLGVYGATKVRTPNIDRLAREGRRFVDAHTPSPVCTPSRYGLLLGAYPIRGGLDSKPVFARSPLVFDPESTTLADVFQRAGYATAWIGKWHLGFGTQTPDWNQALKPGPLESGFDHYFGIPVVNSHPPFVLVEDHFVVGLDPDDPLKYGKNPPNTEPFREKFPNFRESMTGGARAHAAYQDRRLGEQFTERVVGWIREQREKPFFMIYSTHQIHHPFTPAERFVGTSDAGMYGDFIHELDWSVGEILKALDELELADNTIVIFTSDNGGMLNMGGQEAWQLGHRMNGHLLGFKFDAWEGGHRVPFIVRWPGRVPANSESRALICTVDLLATFAGLLDQPLGPRDAPDSLDILSTWTGDPETPIRDELLVEASRQGHFLFRSGPWAYINDQGGGGFTDDRVGTHLFGGPAALSWAGQENSDIVEGRFRADAPKVQLYDLASDPKQAKNLAQDRPELVEQLDRRLQAVRRAPGSRPGVAIAPDQANP